MQLIDNCGCEHRGLRIYPCQYHQGWQDALEWACQEEEAFPTLQLKAAAQAYLEAQEEHDKIFYPVLWGGSLEAAQEARAKLRAAKEALQEALSLKHSYT